MDDVITDDMLIIRKQFLRICDNNLIAALLLYTFEEDANVEEARASLDERDKKILFYTNEALANYLCNLFSPEEVFQTNLFLEKKKFIETWWHKTDDTTPLSSRIYCVKYNKSFVENTIHPPLTQQELLELRQELKDQNVTAPLLPIQKERVISLEGKYKVENSRVLYQNKRAKKLGLPDTLTINQWIATLNYFNWRCAFCGGEYTLLEHVTPLNHGKGTTQNNCVPGCKSCNLTKGPYHPEALPETVQNRLGRKIQKVQKYLNTLGGEVEGE